MILQRFKNDSKPSIKLNNIQIEAKKEVDEKVKNGVYKFETISCPVCNSMNYELLSEKDRYGLEYYVVICTQCGLIYTNPRMTQGSYNSFYDSEYRRLYVGREVPTESFFNKQYGGKGEKIYKFIKETFPEKNISGLNVLEIGCGAGGILYYFKRQGCYVKGVDLGSEYLQWGKKNYNLDLIHGSLKNVSQDFIPDIVIYSHVMEHITDINSELRHLYSKCHENTLLYIEVPGVKNIHNAYKMDVLKYFQNAHIFHFTFESLKNLLVKNNFKLIKGNEYIRSVFIKETEQNSQKKIESDYLDVRNYLKKIEPYRFLYPFKLSSIKRRFIFITYLIFKKLKLFEPLKKLIKNLKLSSKDTNIK